MQSIWTYRFEMLRTWSFVWSRNLQGRSLSALLCGLLLFSTGCRMSPELRNPTIIFTHIPAAGGGSEIADTISGRVVGSIPKASVVLYALSKGTWWVQPLRSHEVTQVASDGSWVNATHLGTEYAVLLVAPGYLPPGKLQSLPPVDGSVLAVASTKASPGSPVDQKVIHFSGYDWSARSFVGNRGGELCDYEPSNAWVDDRGYLHLFMGQVGDRWHCAGLRLTRSLGYGTYRFVLSDSSHLPVSAVLGIYTLDADGGEMDIQLGRWGRSRNKSADYAIQPYYIPENFAHFDVTPGQMTHLVRWEPGIAAFRSYAGSAAPPRVAAMEHVFKSGVPVPSGETLHLDFFDFHHSQSGLRHPVEVVIEKFEYVP